MDVMKPVCLAIAALMALGACTDWPDSRQQIETFDLVAETRRTIEWSYYDLPFRDGAVTVLTGEQDRLNGYTLVPCRGGTRVCAGSAHGRAGTMLRTPDYLVVQGAYPGRVFYLAPGGDGYVLSGSAFTPLAWN